MLGRVGTIAAVPEHAELNCRDLGPVTSVALESTHICTHKEIDIEVSFELIA